MPPPASRRQRQVLGKSRTRWSKRKYGRSKRRVRKFVNGIRYFLRRPRITSTAPEIRASAVPAEDGLTSGAGATCAQATLPIAINNIMLPNSFTVDPPFLGNFVLRVYGIKEGGRHPTCDRKF